MANQQRSNGVSNDPGSEINPMRSIIPVDGKSFIVGKYDEYGYRKAIGKPTDAHEVSTVTKLMNNSMRTRGGETMQGFVMTPQGPVKASQFTPRVELPKSVQVSTSKTKRSKKGKATTAPVTQTYLQEVEQSIHPEESTYEVLTESARTETFPVIFNIESGTIRSQADAILEDEFGLILVYSNSDSISYVPKRGGKLTLTLPSRKVSVMYLGVQCRWFNTNQELLVFIKLDKE